MTVRQREGLNEWNQVLAQSVLDALTGMFREASGRLLKIVIKDDPEDGLFSSKWQNKYRHEDLDMHQFFDTLASMPNLQVLQLHGFPVPRRRDSFDA